MSRRRRHRPDYYEEPYASADYGPDGAVLGPTALGVLCGLVVGVLLGYVLGIQTSGSGGSVASVAPVPVTTSAQVGPAEQEIQAYRNIVQTDPKNLRANVELGNRLYDAGRYAEAVPYYQQAFALNPKDVNVSTDLGTALWYSGRADEALAQFAKSLAIAPNHAQTLFNTGIVRRDGKQDALGAIQSWERLLETNPSYPESAKVRQLIGEAKSQAGPIAPSRTGRS